jgi:nucleotidyltransferase/DNA polymerase involved in DNA repair
MSLSDQLRSETSRGIQAKQREELARQELEKERREELTKRLSNQVSSEIYPQLVSHLKEKARKGNRTYSFNLGSASIYGSNREEAGIKYDLLKGLLEKEGFKIRWESTEHDYGDSAAPARVTEWDMIIEW